MSDNIEYESDNDDYMEDEYIIKKREEIANFTLNDYMSCDATRDLLMTNWQEKFDDNLEKSVEEIYETHYKYLKDTMSNVLYRADKHHVIDLLSLVQHHLVRDYDTSIFYENPDLADPLVSDFNRIEQERKEALNNRYSKAFSKANKKFDWSTMSNKLPQSDSTPEQSPKSTVDPELTFEPEITPDPIVKEPSGVYNPFKTTPIKQQSYDSQTSYTVPKSYAIPSRTANKTFDWSNRK